jgi:hypothetical protein
MRRGWFSRLDRAMSHAKCGKCGWRLNLITDTIRFDSLGRIICYHCDAKLRRCCPKCNWVYDPNEHWSTLHRCQESKMSSCPTCGRHWPQFTSSSIHDKDVCPTCNLPMPTVSYERYKELEKRYEALLKKVSWSKVNSSTKTKI